MERLEITAERTAGGAWSLSAIVGGYRLHRSYYYYTKAQALAQFRQYIKEQNQ